MEENEELLSDGLEQDIYSNIVTYLTVHDIQLIVYTLECLYQLSELGEAAGTHIASAQRAVGELGDDAVQYRVDKIDNGLR